MSLTGTPVAREAVGNKTAECLKPRRIVRSTDRDVPEVVAEVDRSRFEDPRSLCCLLDGNPAERVTPVVPHRHFGISKRGQLRPDLERIFVAHRSRESGI